MDTVAGRSVGLGVLLVDDQAMFTGLLALTVKAISLNFEIERASSLQMAKQLMDDRVISGKPFCSLVTDYRLDDSGRTTSIDLVTAAVEQGSRVAVISADTSEAVVNRCVAAGASAFIEKKMDEHQLKLCLELFFGGVNFVPTPPQNRGRVTEDKDLIMLYYISTGLKFEQIALITGKTPANVKAQATRVIALFAKRHGIPLPAGSGQRAAMAPEMRRLSYHELPDYLQDKVKN